MKKVFAVLAVLVALAAGGIGLWVYVSSNSESKLPDAVWLPEENTTIQSAGQQSTTKQDYVQNDNEGEENTGSEESTIIGQPSTIKGDGSNVSTKKDDSGSSSGGSSSGGNSSGGSSSGGSSSGGSSSGSSSSGSSSSGSSSSGSSSSGGSSSGSSSSGGSSSGSSSSGGSSTGNTEASTEGGGPQKPIIQVGGNAESGEYNGLQYSIDNKAVTITGYTGSSKSVVIPEKIGDGYVSRIADEAFKDKGITSITLPSTLQSVGKWAFAGNCNDGSLQVSLPSSCTSIGAGAFAGISVTSASGAYTLDKGCVYYGTTLVSGSGRSSDSMSKGGTYVIKAGTTEIARGAFYKCSALGRVEFPDTLKTLNEYAFHGCSGITGATLPKGVTYIPRQCFTNCDSLSIIVMMYKKESEDLIVFVPKVSVDAKIIVKGPDGNELPF